MKKILSVSLLAVAASGALRANEVMDAMVSRLLPGHESRFQFELIGAPDATDWYRVEASGDKVLISGNSNNSLAVGLNRYLMNDCGTYVSWWATDSIAVPDVLPLPAAPLAGTARVDDRFFLNYCTYGYTMPFWSWSDWERLIDWMALNGVNMPLACTGQESIWYDVWTRLGIPGERVRAYFGGPAHLPWHRMCNIDYWQGPMPLSYLENQEELQHKILRREREFDMTPVLPAFSGHVPKELADVFPDAAIHGMSNWGGANVDDWRAHFIEPSDPLFDRIQRMYLEEQTRRYGTGHVYGVDPFNEIDVPDWSEAYLSATARRIYDSLAAVDPDARWLQMTWMFYYMSSQWTPSRIEAFLSSVPGDRLILLDYYCDRQELWKSTDSYHGKPYIWCYLGNFGGNSMLAGQPGVIGDRIDNVLARGGSNLAGLGGTLEGLDVNPQMHEFILSRAWDDAPSALSPADWMASWGSARGNSSSAWKELATDIYTTYSNGCQSVLINSRPCFEKFQGWNTNPFYDYDNGRLGDIWARLVADKTPTDAHRHDVVNIGRQYLGNKFADLRAGFTAAYNARDLEAMRLAADSMNRLLADYDRLLSTMPMFSIGKWIADARALGVTPAEKDYYETNARTIVTTWRDAGCQLNEYANRGWGGLTRSYYAPRWAMFTAGAIKAVEAGGQFDTDAFNRMIVDWEWAWANSHDEQFPIVSGEDPIAVAAELIATWR